MGLVLSTIITLTLDQGVQAAPAFSLVHHYPEALGFLIISLGLGMAIGMRDPKIKKLSKVASAVVFCFYTAFAILQLGGVSLPMGVPFFIPSIIVLGLITGYIIDRHFYSR